MVNFKFLAQILPEIWIIFPHLFSPIFGQVQTTDRQTTDRRKVMHMSPPCNLHRWAQKRRSPTKVCKTLSSASGVGYPVNPGVGPAFYNTLSLFCRKFRRMDFQLSHYVMVMCQGQHNLMNHFFINQTMPHITVNQITHPKNLNTNKQIFSDRNLNRKTVLIINAVHNISNCDPSNYPTFIIPNTIVSNYKLKSFCYSHHVFIP